VTAIPAAFVQALEAHREQLNERYAQRHRAGSRIDGSALLGHLQHSVAPLVGQVAAELPEKTASVALALYDVSLDLLAASLLGPDAKMPWVERVWQEVLPEAAKLLAREPQQVAGCLCNAAFQIASQRGDARPQAWLERMRQIAPYCQSVDELLESGKIAGWLAGMVQYRSAALAAAAALRAALATRVLGLPESTPVVELTQVLGRLQDHVWLSVEQAAGVQPEPVLAPVATAGAFSGLGGLFFKPPVVRAVDERLLVTDGKSEWELLADAYGTWFHRLSDSPDRRAKTALPTGVTVDDYGIIRWGKQTLAQPHLVPMTSIAVAGRTLAITIPTSHHVFLISNLGISA
jgi:hypothetical protein